MQKRSSDILPEKLFFEIGGYSSDSYKVELTENALNYYKRESYLYGEVDSSFKPSKAEWKQFREVLNEIDIWSWSKQYESDVLDGTQWSLKIAYKDRSIKSYGSNAYPDPKNLCEGVVLEYSEPFDNLISALKNVTSDKCFNSSQQY